MISAIVLAAGLSSRFGSPKPLAQWDHETVVEKIQKTLIPSRIFEVIIVLGAHAQEIKPFLLKHIKVKVVYNKDYNLGQTSSFQTGINAADSSTDGFLLWPVDYPGIRQETIDRMTEYFHEREPHILIPTYQGRKGHPPIFHARLKRELLQLNVTEGVNILFKRYDQGLASLPLADQGVVLTFNTVEEFKTIRSILCK